MRAPRTAPPPAATSLTSRPAPRSAAGGRWGSAALVTIINGRARVRVRVRVGLLLGWVGLGCYWLGLG